VNLASRLVLATAIIVTAGMLTAIGALTYLFQAIIQALP